MIQPRGENRILPAPKKYDAETQERAVRMYLDRLAEGEVSQLAARKEVGKLLGVNQSTLRNWIRRDTGEGVTPAPSGGESLARLRKENAQLRRANEMANSPQRLAAARNVTGVLLPWYLMHGSSHDEDVWKAHDVATQADL